MVNSQICTGNSFIGYAPCLRLFIQNRIITAHCGKGGQINISERTLVASMQKRSGFKWFERELERESWKKLIVKASQSLNMLIRSFHKFHFSILPRCYAILCNAMPYYALLCHAITCYARLCYAMLCHTMVWFQHLQPIDRKASGWSDISVGERHLFIINISISYLVEMWSTKEGFLEI